MGEAAEGGLRLFSHGLFSPPADAPGLVAASPTIDLSAAVSGGNAVYIRRRGGEVVSKLTERSKTVQALAWRADGQFLAVAWSDGVVRLAGLESPKAVHHIRLFDGRTPVPITCISWSRNLVGSRESWTGPGGSGHSSLLGDRGPGDGPTGEVLNLPHALLFLEVEEDIPKLPPLPVSGGSGDDMFVFSTRTSLEFMFPPLSSNEEDAIHIMVLGTADGLVHVSIYDAFVMGTFQFPLLPRAGADAQEHVGAGGGDGDKPLLHLCHHASHPANTTHALLLANKDKDNQAVYLVPMDFVFIYRSPLNLSLLAYKTTTFLKLLRYIKQTQVHMQGEWHTARELPARFLANVQEDLQKEPKRKSIDHALRVAALTGHVSPTVKQWLVDTIGDRGYKRWDKATTGGLENLRDLIHENMLPALDRAMLALSRLHGLADFHRDDEIGVSPDQIAHLMDLTSCLILASRNALMLVTAELDLFVHFSIWLRSLIEQLTMPSQAEDQLDKEPDIIITPTLDYITNHLLASPLDLHFGKTSQADRTADLKAVEECTGPLFDKLEEELQIVDSEGVANDYLALLENGAAPRNKQRRHSRQPAGDVDGRKGKQPERGVGFQRMQMEDDDDEIEGEDDKEKNGAKMLPHMKAFPTFEFLTKLFSTRADLVLRDIAQSGRQHVHCGPTTRLSVGLTVQKSAVAMTTMAKADPEESADALVFTAFTTKQHRRNVHIFRSVISTDEGISKTVMTQACVFEVGTSGSITDLQFLGAELLLVLWAPSAKDHHPRVLAIPVQSPQIRYANYVDDGSSERRPQLPTLQLAPDASTVSGTSADGLCWASGELPPPAGGGEDRGRHGRGGSGPIVRMEVLGPRGGSPDTAAVGGGNYDGTEAARVCLLHADGATYRVFSLPPMGAMFA